jgi:hypothetical protein
MNGWTNNPSRQAMLLVAIFSLMGIVPAKLAADTYTTFDFPGVNDTRGFGINEAGNIVGLYQDVDRNIHGFVLQRE